MKFVSASIARAILTELEQTGADVSELCKQLEVPLPRAGGQPGDDLPLHHFEHLVHSVLATTRDPGVGLTLGLRTPHYSLHAISGAMRTAESLRFACTTLQRYAPALAGPLSFSLREEGHLSFLEFGFRCDSRELRRFVSEYTLALTHTLLSQAVGGELAVRELRLSYEPSWCPDPKLRELGGVVSFGRPSNGLGFCTKLLDRPSLQADPQLHLLFCQVADHALIDRPAAKSFRAGVLRALRCEESLAHVDLARIASSWGISPRMLSYRLRREGCSFGALLNEARFRNARKELNRSDLSIKEVAERFGYSELSSFHRAFKRWSGLSPGEYRKTLRS